MPFWWVNHKQTFKEETSGGYIWSPKTSSNGARNPTYINLTLTHPGDVVFSYANKKIAAIGVVAAPCAEQGKPEEFGNRGENWQQSGWVVPIDWVSLPVPWVPSDYIDEFKHLLPSVHSPLRPDGNGNQGCYLASISDELGSLLLGWLGESNPSQVVELSIEQLESLDGAQLDSLKSDASIDATQRQQLINARRGQGTFRKNVTAVESVCRVTGLSDAAFLIASHIKPWRDSDNQERLDGNNGLLLSPHIDRLFDQGWITFSDEGDLLVSSELAKAVLARWGVSLPLNVGSFNADQSGYLSYHRERVFNPR